MYAAYMENTEHPVKAWLRVDGRSQRWLADKIGLGYVELSKNLTGKALPAMRTKLAIQAVSNGAVMAADWPEDKP